MATTEFATPDPTAALVVMLVVIVGLALILRKVSGGTTTADKSTQTDFHTVVEEKGGPGPSQKSKLPVVIPVIPVAKDDRPDHLKLKTLSNQQMAKLLAWWTEVIRVPTPCEWTTKRIGDAMVHAGRGATMIDRARDFWRTHVEPDERAPAMPKTSDVDKMAVEFRNFAEEINGCDRREKPVLPPPVVDPRVQFVRYLTQRFPALTSTTSEAKTKKMLSDLPLDNSTPRQSVGDMRANLSTPKAPLDFPLPRGVKELKYMDADEIAKQVLTLLKGVSTAAA